jgi:hypothetical protein
MTLDRFRQFQPAGPVAVAFMADTTSLMRALLGPVGGGKSVTCIFDSLKSASSMPICNDGVIRFRLAVIGATYGQMERNLFPTWTEWLPRDGGDWTEAEFTGGGGRFATHKISFDVLRGGQRVEVRFEAIFAAIGEFAVEAFMRGFEPTAFWLYEMDLLPEAVLDHAIFRIGRYPAQHQLPAGSVFRPYVIGDLNAPDIDSWFYRRFEEERPAGHRLYKQPSGRSPRAENIRNLPPGYYDRQVMALANRPKLIKRMVDAQYGPAGDGEPVYPEYADELHLAPEPLKPMKGIPIRLGLDQGVQRPAAIGGQRLPNGQMRILFEVVPGRMGPRRFAQAVKRELAEVAPGHPIEIGYADPAGFYGADKEGGEMAWAEIVSAELQIPILPAPSNEISLRLDAVRDDLSYHIDGITPGLLISPVCRMLRKGFASHYRYRVERVGGTTKTSDKPEKNDWSNPHDALQYLELGDKGRYGVISGERPGKAAATATGSGGCSMIRNTARIFG